MRLSFIPGFRARAVLSRRQRRSTARPQVEALESRAMPYATTSNAWPHPERVTLSVMPDGTNLGGPTSNLFSQFNTAFGSASAWQNVLLKAAQAWAQQTNLNFSFVSDNGTASGGGAYQQGDPGMGDLRFGGFAFSNSSILALGYMPPPVNNYSVAGDIPINTAKVFNINGTDYDLYTVMMHEVGHALGLNHSSSVAAVLYSAYEGVDSGLTSDDIAGIRAIYGTRTSDALDAAAANGSFAAASNVSSKINSTSLTALLTKLDITSTSDVDYYTFTAPSNSAGTMTVSVQSKGLSLLAPSLRIYDSAQTQLAAATGAGYQGSTLTASVNITPGRQYYVRVAGANTTAFGTGAYALTLNLGTGAAPSVPIPNTQVANSSPQNGGGGVANRTDENGLSVSSLLIGTDRTINNITDGGLVGGLVDDAVSTVVELPFVDSIEPAARFEADRRLSLPTTSTTQAPLPILVAPPFASYAAFVNVVQPSAGASPAAAAPAFPSIGPPPSPSLSDPAAALVQGQPPTPSGVESPSPAPVDSEIDETSVESAIPSPTPAVEAIASPQVPTEPAPSREGFSCDVRHALIFAFVLGAVHNGAAPATDRQRRHMLGR